MPWRSPLWLTELRARARAAATCRLRAVAGGRFAPGCRPTTVNILLTERRNARCVHCDIWKNRGKEDAPTRAQWTAALDDLRRWLGPVHVVFTGGEALLVPFAPELVAHAAALGLLVEHLTHGYWSDPSRVERMARARPWRVTVSCDGIGPTHDLVRGRAGFFDATRATIATLVRLRRELRLGYTIRLKTVVMAHNLDQVGALARFARAEGLEVFYQPVEQNYNTPHDPHWFEHSPNWPADPERAVAAVRSLIGLKRQGYPIANSERPLAVMIPYFRDPRALMVATQNHVAHQAPVCSALTDLQIQADGGVKTCWAREPVGNIKTDSVRTAWENRPAWWSSGCCHAERMHEAERAALAGSRGPV